MPTAAFSVDWEYQVSNTTSIHLLKCEVIVIEDSCPALYKSTLFFRRRRISPHLAYISILLLIKIVWRSVSFGLIKYSCLAKKVASPKLIPLYNGTHQHPSLACTGVHLSAHFVSWRFSTLYPVPHVRLLSKIPCSQYQYQNTIIKNVCGFSSLRAEKTFHFSTLRQKLRWKLNLGEIAVKR